MSKEAVLFDWDGTLAQTLDVWLKTFKEAYELVGVHPSDRDISSRFGKWDAYIELGVTPDNVATYNAHLETVYDKLAKVELYPGARKVLLNLRERNVKLGLVSTSTKRMLDTALCNDNILDLFDVVISADDTDKHKPDPTPLYMALERLGVAKESAIFVGDSDKDVGAAQNAGMPLILFAPASHELFYDIEDLSREPMVKASFPSWEQFPYEALEDN